MPGLNLMTGIKSFFLSREEKSFILSHNITGVILFKRNIQSFQQVYELCRELKSLTSPPLLIAVDAEGGEVNRFSHLESAPKWPSAKILKNLEPHQIFLSAKNLAQHLQLLGIDINFAPVVDLLLKPNPLLENRVFGKSKEEILVSAEAFIRGLKAGGLIPCLKHFPGHGGVGEDSHTSLPVDKRTVEELKAQLQIFQELCKKHSSWIMTAHINFSNIDNQPATFSQILLKKLLREELQFKGLLVSDDIDMKALKPFPPEECFLKAIQGGCDLVISCDETKNTERIVEYFKKHPEKTEPIKEALKSSSRKIMEIREKTKGPLLDFQSVQREISRLKTENLSPLA